MPLKTKQITVVEMCDWDNFVVETYGRPYKIQQQEGCREREMLVISVPCAFEEEERYMHNDIPDTGYSEYFGVKFNEWLKRVPAKETKNVRINQDRRIFWHRHFYPNLNTLANALYLEGLIEAGTYYINIDW